MSAKKRSRPLLPDLDQLAERSTSNKRDIAAVKSACQELFSAELGQCSSHLLKNIDESVKFTWLIVRYGARIVLPLLIATQRMPMSLTDHQLLAYMRDAIHQRNDASDTDIEAICHMLTQECSNLTSELAIALNTSTTFCSTLFAPPTRECIICQRRLVSYHTTDVIYYRCTGVLEAKKISLRCLDYSMIYNYAQYGNKAGTGFRFYDSEREAVEVTDGIFFERKLLDFQCSLA